MSYNKETGMYEGYIYCITNKVNGKQYIGQTIRTVERRWYEHTKRNVNSILNNAINKYGKENFLIETVKLVSAENKGSLIELLANYEIYFISTFNSLVPNGYNNSSGGESGSAGCHFIMSQDHKDKISKSHIGIRPSEETKKKISAIKKGTITSDETKEKLRITSSRYRHSEESKQKISKAHKGKKKSYVGNTNFLEKSKPVCQYDLYGHFIERFPSAREAARQLNIEQALISKCCNGICIFYKKSIWKYDNGDYSDIILDTDFFIKFNKTSKNKTVQQFTLDGTLLYTYDSLSDASKSTGFSKSGISQCCIGNYKQSCGYIWKYNDEFR